LQDCLNGYRTEKETIEVDEAQMKESDLEKLCSENGVLLENLRRKGSVMIVELKAYNRKDIDIIKHKCEIQKLSLEKQQAS